MRVDVLLGEAAVAPVDVADRVVVVIDVLRAATTVATALASGARVVIPFETVDETATRAKAYARGEVKLAGERRMKRIDGFDLGNSPGEYTRESVGGFPLLYTTTNGTAALAAVHGARACFFAGFVNASATVAAVDEAAAPDGDVLILCAGSDRRIGLEDVVCAGRLIRGLAARRGDVTREGEGREGLVRGDGARVAELVERAFVDDLMALAHEAEHARLLADAGFAADVSACLTVDQFDSAVRYHDRQLFLASAPAAR